MTDANLNKIGTIWYHGTEEKTSKIILKEGFKELTYFTWDLHAALNMGGGFVFSIYLKNKSSSDYWQWRTPNIILPNKIRERIHHKKVQKENLYNTEY